MDCGHLNEEFIENCRKTLVSLSYPHDGTLNIDEVTNLLLSTGAKRTDFLIWILDQMKEFYSIRCQQSSSIDRTDQDELGLAYRRLGLVTFNEVKEFISGSANEFKQYLIWKKIFNTLNLTIVSVDEINDEPCFKDELKKLCSSKHFDRLKHKNGKLKKKQEEKLNLENLNTEKESKLLCYVSVLCRELKNNDQKKNIRKKNNCSEQLEKPNSDIESGEQENVNKLENEEMKIMSSMFHQFMEMYRNDVEPYLCEEQLNSEFPKLTNASMIHEIHSAMKKLKNHLDSKATIVQKLEELNVTIQNFGMKEDVSHCSEIKCSPLADIMNIFNDV